MIQKQPTILNRTREYLQHASNCFSSSTDYKLHREHVRFSTGLGGLQSRPISMASLWSEIRNFVMVCLAMGLEITDKYGSGSSVLGLISL